MNAITNIETIKLKAPFPWFGGKSKIAADLWLFFGADVANYVKPFFGSGISHIILNNKKLCEAKL